MELTVTVSAPLRPTEEISKVAKCIRYMIDINGKKGGGQGDELSERDLENDLRVSLGNEKLMVRISACGGEQTVGSIAVIGGIELLEAIHYNIRKEKIIDTAHTALMKGLSDDECRTVFFLNKQVAYARRLNFPADEEPLGSIEVAVSAETPEALERVIDWLTPPTHDGVPIYEQRLEDLK